MSPEILALVNTGLTAALASGVIALAFKAGGLRAELAANTKAARESAAAAHDLGAAVHELTHQVEAGSLRAAEHSRQIRDHGEVLHRLRYRKRLREDPAESSA